MRGSVRDVQKSSEDERPRNRRLPRADDKRVVPKDASRETVRCAGNGVGSVQGWVMGTRKGATDGDLGVPDSLVQNPLSGTKYTAISLIGQGGMGEVYLADHDELGKRFVVKLLHTEMATDPRLVDRVRMEAQSLARLRHQCIVDVIDFGKTPSGRPYLVMERLTGVTLADAVRQRGAFDPGDAVWIVRQLLSALIATHAVGMIHRDIKLSNLFLHEPPGREPVLKVLDFGLAKVMDARIAGNPAPLRFPTEEGVVVGTPRYLAPEAWAGKGVDHRADIFATGVVLYHLLAGRGPWDDLRKPQELLERQLAGRFEAPSALAPGPISVELDLIVERALSPKPEKRFQTAEAFDHALGAVAAPAASGVGWTQTTMLRELMPDAQRSEGEASTDHPLSETERDIPPTEEAAVERVRDPQATEELPPDIAPRMPGPASTRTALRVDPIPTTTASTDALAPFDPSEPPESRPPRLVVVFAVSAAVAVAIGFTLWWLLSWLGGH